MFFRRHSSWTIKIQHTKTKSRVRAEVQVQEAEVESVVEAGQKWKFRRKFLLYGPVYSDWIE